MIDRLFNYTAIVDEDTALSLSTGPADWYTIQVNPPVDQDSVPVTVTRFVREILELQSSWLGLRNSSPLSAFEIRRPRPDQAQIQFAVPTKRLERKVRLHLTESIPGIRFQTGVSGLPVSEGDTVGGGLLTVGREDMFPLSSEFERPPTNNVVAPLHRDAFPSERVVIQILFQPVAGRPLRRWLWTRKAYKRIGYLKKEKHAVSPWVNRPATKAEKRQADTVEDKARNPRFNVAIRILLVGTQEDHVRSRVKEIGGAFNVYESSVTNQYLNTHTIKSVFPRRILKFAESVSHRRLDGWTLPFQAGIREVAGLVAVPTIEQRNVRRASP